MGTESGRDGSPQEEPKKVVMAPEAADNEGDADEDDGIVEVGAALVSCTVTHWSCSYPSTTLLCSHTSFETDWPSILQSTGPVCPATNPTIHDLSDL